MFGITSKLTIIQFVVILIMIGIGYIYFRYSQGVIADLNASNARLQTAIETQEATIAAQRQAAERQNAENLRLQQGLADADRNRRELEGLIRRRNLEAMARANSQDLEQRINRATVQAFRDIENITTPRDRPSQNQIPQRPSAQPQSPTQSPPASQIPTNYQPPPRPPRTVQQGASR